MHKKILVTGCAGFIGYSISMFLLKKKYKVFGLDNYSTYYDVRIKKKRVSELLNFPNFRFNKIDLNNSKKLNKLFKYNKFDIVLNLAAQAGVRYSFINPSEYIRTNINGFFNLIEISKTNKIKHFIYASSSSVYGLTDKTKSSEEDNVDHPISLYAATKRSNELIAHSYSYNFNLRTTGLRFFTVYGEFGRPDMSIFKFIKKTLQRKYIQVFNHGKHQRSFSNINDVCNFMFKIIESKSKIIKSKKINPGTSIAPFEIFNIGNPSKISLINLIKIIENKIGLKIKKKYLGLQKGDIVSTHASDKKLKKNFKINFKVDIKKGVDSHIKWFLKNKKFLLKLKD